MQQLDVQQSAPLPLPARLAQPRAAVIPRVRLAQAEGPVPKLLRRRRERRLRRPPPGGVRLALDVDLGERGLERPPLGELAHLHLREIGLG